MGETRRDLDEDLRHVLASLPILALRGTVFFANTMLPLRICDAEHTRFLDDVFATTRFLGVVLLRGGQALPHRVGQVAKVIQHSRGTGGHYDLMLQGMGRFQMAETKEQPPRSNLWARCILLPSDQEDAAAVATELRRFFSCYQKFLELCPESPDILGEVCSGIQEPDMLADVICATLLDDLSVRQRALEELSCIRRLQMVGAHLSATLLKRLERDGPIH